MPKGRHKKRKPTSQVRHLKRLISRHPKRRKIEIVARRGQPQVTALVPRIRKEDVGGSVASSWISALAWDETRGITLMSLLDGKLYDVPIPFKMFERWFYALSKGTFFNRVIRHSRYYDRIKRVF